MDNTKAIPWYVALIGQAVGLAAVAAASCFTTLLPANVAIVAYNAAIWAIYPIFALILTALSARCGVNAYLAWLPPPTVHALTTLLFTGWLTPATAMLLYALIGIFGAATGEEWGKRGDRHP